MTGLVCLQGGAEFGAACRAMDGDLVARTTGPVVVSALAGEVGRDYATATARGVAHLRAVGAREVVAAPDVRQDETGALAALGSAGLLVLPGGSPSRLLEALTRTPAGGVIRERLLAGAAVLGSSAGAMVLGSWTVLPDRRGADGPVVVRGLDLVPGVLVVPHWSDGASRNDWLRAVREQVPAGLEVLGLPEESGVVVEGRTLTAVGRGATRLVTTGRDLAVGQSWSLT